MAPKHRKSSRSKSPAAPVGASAAALTAVLCVAYVACESLLPLFGPTMLALSDSASVPKTELAVLPSASAVGSVAGGLLAGVIFDAVPFRGLGSDLVRANFVLVVMMVLQAAFNALLPSATTLPAMTGLALALGATNGLFRAGSNCLVLRLHGAGAAPHMQALHLFGGFGRIIGPGCASVFLTGSSDYARGLQQAYWAASALPLLAAAVLAGYSLVGGVASIASPSEASGGSSAAKKQPAASAAYFTSNGRFFAMFSPKTGVF